MFLVALIYLFCGFWTAAFVLLFIVCFALGFVPGWLVSLVVIYALIQPFRRSK